MSSDAVAVEDAGEGPDASAGLFDHYFLTGLDPSLYYKVTGGFVTFAQGGTGVGGFDGGEIIVFQDREVHRFSHRTGLGKVAWAAPNSKDFAVLADSNAGRTVEVLLWNPEEKSLELFARDLLPLNGGVTRDSATHRTAAGIIYLKSSFDDSIVELDLTNGDVSVIELPSPSLRHDDATGRAALRTREPDGVDRGWAYEPTTNQLTDLGKVRSVAPRVTPDGSGVVFLAAEAPGGLQIWDFDSGNVSVVEDGFRWDPMYLDDGRLVALFGTSPTPSADDSLKIYDLTTGDLVLEEDYADRDSFVVSADATRVAFLSNDSVVTRSLVDGSREDFGGWGWDIVVTSSAVGFRSNDFGYVVWHEDTGRHDFEEMRDGVSEGNGDIWLMQHVSMDRGLVFHAPTESMNTVSAGVSVLDCGFNISADGSRTIFKTFDSDAQNRLYLWSLEGGLRILAHEGMQTDVGSPPDCRPVSFIRDDLRVGVVSWESTGARTTAWRDDDVFRLEETSVFTHDYDADRGRLLYAAGRSTRSSRLKLVDLETWERVTLDDHFTDGAVRFHNHYLWVGRGTVDGEGLSTHLRAYPQDGSAETIDLLERITRVFVLFDDYLLYEAYGQALHVALPRQHD